MQRTPSAGTANVVRGTPLARAEWIGRARGGWWVTAFAVALCFLAWVVAVGGAMDTWAAERAAGVGASGASGGMGVPVMVAAEPMVLAEQSHGDWLGMWIGIVVGLVTLIGSVGGIVAKLVAQGSRVHAHGERIKTIEDKLGGVEDDLNETKRSSAVYSTELSHVNKKIEEFERKLEEMPERIAALLAPMLRGGNGGKHS